jgi:hypothetical protein
MIDEGIYNNEWVLLCERFRLTGEKEPSRMMRKRYFEYLDRRIDTAEFQKSCRRIYAEAEFFPRPIDFVPNQSGKRCALEQWEKLLPLLRNSSSPLDSLDEPAKRAVRAMGGLSNIGRDAEALHFRRSEFADLYESFAESEEHLPQVTDQSQETLRALGLG